MIAIQFIPSFFTCRINPKFGRTKRVTSICAALRYKRIFPVSLSQAHSCILPAITVAGKNLCVSGMCAIVRFLIRRRAAVENGCGRRFPGEKLLGYQGELLLPCHAWLPDGYSRIFRSYVFGPLGFWTMAPLRCSAGWVKRAESAFFPSFLLSFFGGLRFYLTSPLSLSLLNF